MKTVYTILLLFICLITKAQNFPYRYLAPIIISPSEEVNCMFFDKEGQMWVGTNAGVKSYDGYQVKTYKSSAFLPGILPNNTIRSIAEDKNDNLWLGTRNGLVRMNKRTGEFKTFYLPNESQRVIYTLFTSKDGTLWIGTDGGLSYFNPKDESFYTYNNKNTWLIDESGHKAKITNYSVKAIAEDKNGDLLIGTWSAGLLRFNRGAMCLCDTLNSTTPTQPTRSSSTRGTVFGLAHGDMASSAWTTLAMSRTQRFTSILIPPVILTPTIRSWKTQ